MKTQLSAPKRTTSSWVQAMVWLIVALIVGVITLIFWMASSAPTMQPDIVAQAKKKNAQMSLDFNKITHVDNFIELRKEVKPISFDALVRDLRQYPDEFKDKSYFKKHEKDWTVQVMDVAEHEVITAYLDKREDREKFAYLRYRDENDQPRYILTYEAFKTPQLAMGTAKMVDFHLPNNIRVLPEEMARYVSIIDNYELSQPVESVNLNPSYYVRLKPTQEEIPAEPELEDNLDGQSVGADDENLEPQPSIEDSTDTNDVLAVNVMRQLSSNSEDLSNNTIQDAANSTLPTPTDSPMPARPSSPVDNKDSADKPTDATKNTATDARSNTPTIKPTITLPSVRINAGRSNNDLNNSAANMSNKPSSQTNARSVSNPINRTQTTASSGGQPKPVPPTDKEDADALEQLIMEKTE